VNNNEGKNINIIFGIFKWYNIIKYSCSFIYTIFPIKKIILLVLLIFYYYYTTKLLYYTPLLINDNEKKKIFFLFIIIKIFFIGLNQI